MTLDPARHRLHRQACEAGQALYQDPESGLWVVTSFHLRKQRACCANGCRHCPWPAEEQRRVGRPDTPAYPWPEP